MIESIQSTMEKELCNLHGRELTFHCKTDEKKGCLKCVKDHAGHDLEDATDQELQSLTSFWEVQSDTLQVNIKFSYIEVSSFY